MPPALTPGGVLRFPTVSRSSLRSSSGGAAPSLIASRSSIVFNRNPYLTIVTTALPPPRFDPSVTCATTSRTFHLLHSDCWSHCAGVSESAIPATAARSLSMMSEVSIGYAPVDDAAGQPTLTRRVGPPRSHLPSRRRARGAHRARTRPVVARRAARWRPGRAARARGRAVRSRTGRLRRAAHDRAVAPGSAGAARSRRPHVPSRPEGAVDRGEHRRGRGRGGAGDRSGDRVVPAGRPDRRG